jgi:aspartate beta-hydroxylase
MADGGDEGKADGAGHAAEEDGAVEERVVAQLELVLREEFSLSKFSLAMAQAWLPRIFATDAPATEEDRFARVRSFLLHKINRKRPRVHEFQKYCPELVPGLRSQPLWAPEDSPHLAWVRELERAAPEIRRELLALRDGGAIGFQAYRAPAWSDGTPADEDRPDGAGERRVASKGSDRGDWNVYYLSLHTFDCSENRARCPATCSVLDAMPRRYEHELFSSLAPGTHVTAHTGPTNKKLRVQLPLLVPSAGSCRLRVGDCVAVHEEGKALIFDDSFEHEAWNDDPAAARVILIADVWHPDLSAEEIKFLAFLRAAQLRVAKKASDRGVLDGADDFFSVLDSERRRGARDPSAVFRGIVRDD